MGALKRKIKSDQSFALNPRFWALFAACAILFFSSETRWAKAIDISTFQPEDRQSGENEQEGRKQGGIVGDPSRHRGLILGYDSGLKAAKGDAAQGRDPAPASHLEYQNPQQFYRYEYGSRANFVSGFRSGFLGAYKTTFGKSIRPENVAITSEVKESKPLQQRRSFHAAAVVKDKPVTYSVSASDAL